jgi:hypothetical protein
MPRRLASGDTATDANPIIGMSVPFIDSAIR